MSQWTHVAGLIRVDSMGAAIVRTIPGDKQEKIRAAIKKAMGNTCDYETSITGWDQCNVPRGSEGSLQYTVSRNSDEDDHGLSWGYISIWGDLRDYGTEDVEEIVKWLQKSLEKLMEPEGFGEPADMSDLEKANYMLSSFMIRDAVLSVDVEYSDTTILLWDNDKRKVRVKVFR